MSSSVMLVFIELDFCEWLKKTWLIKKKKIGKKEEKHAAIAFDSQLFIETQFNFSVYYEDFSGCISRWTFFYCFWSAKIPVSVLTHDRSLTHFFSQKLFIHLYGTAFTVLSCKNLLAYFPCRANSAADFLSGMQRDFSLSLKIKRTDHVPIHENEIETEAKVPDVSLSNSSETTQFFEDLLNVVDDQFINQL